MREVSDPHPAAAFFYSKDAPRVFMATLAAVTSEWLKSAETATNACPERKERPPSLEKAGVLRMSVNVGNVCHEKPTPICRDCW